MSEIELKLICMEAAAKSGQPNPYRIAKNFYAWISSSKESPIGDKAERKSRESEDPDA